MVCARMCRVLNAGVACVAGRDAGPEGRVGGDDGVAVCGLMKTSLVCGA